MTTNEIHNADFSVSADDTAPPHTVTCTSPDVISRFTCTELLKHDELLRKIAQAVLL